MWRTLLVSVDGTTASQSAVELGIRWATRFDAVLIGIGIIDQPTLTKPEPTPLGAADFKRRRDSKRLQEAHRQVDLLLGQFVLQAGQAGIATKVLEDVGQPAEQILLEAQRYDVILIGREPRWNWTDRLNPDNTIHHIIESSPRPVVTVPDRFDHSPAILIAYDGSLQAARALAAFQASHLGESQPIHIISVAANAVDATRTAERAADFLAHHGLASTSHRESDADPSTAIIQLASRIQAGLIVMGAYGKPRLHDFFLGSTTRNLIANSIVPIFLTH